MTDFSFSRDERLKSVKLIKQLFVEGRSIFQFPIKLVYIPLPDDHLHIENSQFGVSVPKKRFKKAVDRNRIKRLLREAIRLNKHIISDDPVKVMMIIYVADEELSHKIIQASIKKLLLILHKTATSDV